MTVARDITHRKSLETSLGRGKLQARITLESIGEGVITTDRNGTIDYMNEAAEQLIGGTRSAGIGKRLLDLISLVDEIDRSSLGDPVAKCLSERRRVNLGRRAFLLSKQAEREFSTELTASPIRGPDGQVAGCVVIFHDVSELRGLAREMSYQASHDALTGLVNRAEFERRLETALDSARGEGVGHVVCYLDLDRFKLVNDTGGHIAGDNLLREIGALLKQRVRDSDTVARVGGDEFAMLLAGCPLDKAQQIAEDVVPGRRRPSVRMAGPRVRHRRQRGARRGRQGKRLRRERARRRRLRVLHREAAGPRADARLLDARRGHGARARRDPMAAAAAARAQGERLRALRPADRRDGRAQPQRPGGRGAAAHARRVGQLDPARAFPGVGRALPAHVAHRPLGRADDA